ncbi:MAG TPA: hypothetical protein VF832_01900 [Longimicrobiales bacterium]
MLATWHDFYLVTGTAAAALTALQFVTQTMIASTAWRAMPADDPASGIDAFGSPTVVHFTLALLVSALMCAPWGGQHGLGPTLAVLGAGALVYSAVVLRRARRQRAYRPVAEDWIWHVVLPAAAYAAVLLAALLLGQGAGPLYLVAAATLLLLCAGIHNSWDTVTYLTIAVVQGAQRRGEAARPAPSPSPPPPPPERTP